MAASFTVTEGRGQKMSFQGSPDAISITWTKDYFVDVSGVDPKTVDAYDVLTATGVPVVNRTIYTVGSKVIPFVICRFKSAEQMPNRLDRWKIKTRWEAKGSQEESENQPVDPPDELTDFTPTVVPIFGGDERVLYTDKSATPQRYLTPTNNEWGALLIERIGTLSLKITQYEPATDYSILLDRLFKVNEETYRNQPRYSWIIDGIDRTDVETQLSAGQQVATIITYTVTLSPHEHGWKTDIALIDTHYFDDNSDVVPFADSQPATLRIGLVDEFGNQKSDQTAEPDRIQYEGQDTIDFDTFLQV